MASKYIVGIDLGTTNSALACSDATAPEEERRIEIHSIPQLVNPSEMAERTLLPSFLYIPGEFDFPKGSLALPWDPEPKFVVGELARKRGADGVVCGHIHHAEIRMIGDVLYLNDGDWVESCSALVEDARGNLEILRWASPSQRHASLGSAEAAVPALIPA